jgi:hypothetical protein
MLVDSSEFCWTNHIITGVYLKAEALLETGNNNINTTMQVLARNKHDPIIVMGWSQLLLLQLEKHEEDPYRVQALHSSMIPPSHESN